MPNGSVKSDQLPIGTILAFVVVSIVIGCCETRFIESGKDIEPRQSFVEAVENISLPVAGVNGGIAHLNAGFYEAQSAPGSATKTMVRIAAKVFGDVNADGIADAVIIYTVESGGSGTFYYLGLLMNEDDATKYSGSSLLGDRIAIKSVEIVRGVITVRYLSRLSGQPMAAKPTQDSSKSFVFRSGVLEPSHAY